MGYIHQFCNYDRLIGTAASPATLTASYADNRDFKVAKYMPNMVINGNYVPGAANAVLLILVETSLDGGSTYRGMTVQQNGTTSQDIYAEGTSSSNGIPFKVPGDGTSTQGTAIPFSFQFTQVCDFVRVSCLEVTSGGFGTIHLQLGMTN